MIRVIDKVFDILEMVAREPEKIWPLGSIADPLKMNHGTCANILKSLVTRNYLEKMPAKQGYRLGRSAFKLADNKDFRNELVTVARNEMTRLTESFNENTLLSVLQGSQRVAILRINCEHSIQVVTPVEKNAYDSSTGRLLVAMQPDADLEKYIQQYGLPKLKGRGREISKAAFLQEVKKIRTDGFATFLPDDQILGIAFPVYQHNKVVASISMYAPAFRCNAAKRLRMQKALSKAAQSISEGISR
jgi:DNA-binding IclR family transcriptional regulator